MFEVEDECGGLPVSQLDELFTPRAQNIAIYGMKASPRHAALMKRIGKAKMGGGCMYINSLEGVDQKVLAELITTAMQAKVERNAPRAKAKKKS